MEHGNVSFSVASCACDFAFFGAVFGIVRCFEAVVTHSGFICDVDSFGKGEDEKAIARCYLVKALAICAFVGLFFLFW